MNSAVDPSTIRKPVIHHVHELQKRLTWSLLAVIAAAGVAYSVHDWLLMAVQKPLGQTLYYTSPMGGFNFLLKLCLSVGFVLALPVILYNIFAFLGPLLKRHHKLTISAYALWSFDLAYCGLVFAYFISLPAALHFLSQFGGQDIKALITVDEYFTFALAYLAGFALIFQVPLIILFINRITPLKPGSMMRAQRYVILFSFIAAAVLTPTPDPLNQAIMALPAILLYQIGIILVWLANRSSAKQQKLARAQQRTQQAKHAHTVHAKPKPRIQTVPVPLPVAVAPSQRRSRRSIDGFMPQKASPMPRTPSPQPTADLFIS